MKRKLFNVLVTLLLVFHICGCKKDGTTSRDYPQLRTGTVDHISGDGARFNAMIISGDAESITEHGFVWGHYATLTINSSEKYVVEGAPASDNYYTDVTYALEGMRDYFVRAYIKAGDLVIYGDVVKFKSLGSMAPEITDFEPKSGTWGDTVTIYGKNFGYAKYTFIVLFGDQLTEVVESTNEKIVVRVPGMLHELNSPVSVELLGNRVASEDLFHLITPGEISSIDKTDVTWGDTIELTGTFPFDEFEIKIQIENYIIDPIAITPSKLKFIIPNNIAFKDSFLIWLGIGYHAVAALEKNHMIPPHINEILPHDFGWGDTIQVFGVFYPEITANKLMFSTFQANILEMKRDRITCTVPATTSHECQLSLQSNNLNILYGSISLNGPIVKEFSPHTIAANKSITLTGKYFKPGYTIVKINGVFSSVTVISSTKLSVLIGNNISNGPATLEVSVNSKNVLIENGLIIMTPKIHDFLPLQGTYGDVITINGECFDPGDLIVKLGNNSPQIIEATENLIRFTIPENIQAAGNLIELTTRGCNIIATGSFHLIPPQIFTIEPLTAKSGEIITITGEYFNPNQASNQVYFQNIGSERGFYATIVSMGSNTMDIRLPSMLRGNYKLVLRCLGMSCESPLNISFQSPWSLRDILLSARSFANAIQFDDQLFVFGGQNSYFSFQRFSFLGGDHASFGTCPIYSQNVGVSYNVNNYGYYGIGSSGQNYVKDFYKFDPSDRSWTKMRNFPGNGRMSSFYFSIGNKCYVGAGFQTNNTFFNDFWEYDTSTDLWLQKSNFPGGSSNKAVAFSVNAKAYVIDGKKIWEFNPGTNVWTQKSDFPGVSRYLSTGFVLGNEIYFGTGSLNYVTYGSASELSDFWRYDPATNLWQQLTDIPIPRRACFGVTYDSKGYIGGGKRGEYDINDILEYDLNNE